MTNNSQGGEAKASGFDEFLQALLDSAQRDGHRYLLRMIGGRYDSEQLLAQHLSLFAHRGLVFGNIICFASESSAENSDDGHLSAETGLPDILSSIPQSTVQVATPVTAGRFLGQETGLLIYDAHGGFYPDAFAALTGTLVGGGVLFLLTPDDASWLANTANNHLFFTGGSGHVGAVTTHYLNRFLACLYQHKACAVWDVEQDAGSLPKADAFLSSESRSTDFLTQKSLTPKVASTNLPVSDTGVAEKRQFACRGDQWLAIEAIKRVATGHRNRPLVLQADRGRGKSAALGMAVDALLEAGYEGNIVLTAPSRQAVASVYAFLEKKHVQSVQFVAPDDLVERLRGQDKPGELLLVDEAAAIPIPLLLCFLKGFSRLVFSSTAHGYEGSGRGFRLRFYRKLDALTPQWKHLELKRPVRWSEGDPLEDFLFDSLLLNAEIPPESNALLTDSDRVDAACFRVFEADRQQLASDEKTLRQIFAILVSAHYRTTPDDLLVLLDAPGVRLFVGEYKHCIVAAILVADEGCFDEVCVATDAVWLNRRRLKGHVLPQILAQQSHIKQALELGYWRVMRIAVVPELQARGFGTMMLASVESLLVKACSGCDFMGSSFSASAEVLSFWQQSGYEPVRCGLSRDSRSGEHAMLVLKPLSKKAESVFSLAHALFFQEFCQQLGLGLSSLESSLVEKVIGGRAFRKRSQQAQKNHQKDLPDNYQKDLLAFFAEGKRSLYACRLTAGYFLFSIAGSTRWTQLEKMQRILLIQCFLQHYDERKLVVQHGFSGKKQLLEELRKAIKHLL